MLSDQNRNDCSIRNKTCVFDLPRDHCNARNRKLFKSSQNVCCLFSARRCHIFDELAIEHTRRVINENVNSCSSSGKIDQAVCRYLLYTLDSNTLKPRCIN